jgi:DNA-binding CsgD family transcriptional regulator
MEQEMKQSHPCLEDPFGGMLVFDGDMRPVACDRGFSSFYELVCKSHSCGFGNPKTLTSELLETITSLNDNQADLGCAPQCHLGTDPDRVSIIILFPDETITIDGLVKNRRGSKTPTFREAVLQRRLSLGRGDFEIVDRRYGLTKTELRVLKRCLKGDGTVQIADSLFVSIATVKAHIGMIFKKLGIARRSQILSRLI